MDNKSYAPGSAWKKQLAKEAASKNALKVLLMEYYSRLGDSTKVERLRNMNENEEKISRDVDHPTRFKPQPKAVTSKMSFHLLEAKQLNHRDIKDSFFQVKYYPTILTTFLNSIYFFTLYNHV